MICITVWMVYSRRAGMAWCRPGVTRRGGGTVELTVKITPRVAAPVARRLRLAASVRSRSMSAMVNDALDETLPSLEEIRMQLAAPAAGEAGAGMLADMVAGHRGPVTVIATRGAPAVPQVPGGGGGRWPRSLRITRGGGSRSG